VLFLVDTNAISDLMQQRPTITARLRSIGTPDKVVTCPIVVGEILRGIECLTPGKRRTELEHRSAAIFSIVDCEPLPPEAAPHYARLKIHCQRHGLALDENDFWIAAAALALSATLVTRDKDFTSIPALTLEDWSV
jgi:predicted nucleic acid-binding protein